MTEAPVTTQTTSDESATPEPKTYTVELPELGTISWTPGPELSVLVDDVSDVMGDHEVPALLEALLCDATTVVVNAHLTIGSVFADLQSGNITPEERLEALLDILDEEATTPSGVEVFYLGETPDGPDIVEAERMIAEADLR